MKMDDFANKILKFIKREKIYVFLLVLVLLMNLSLLSFDQFLEGSGLDKIFEYKSLKEEIIHAGEIKDAITSNSTLYLIFAFLFLAFIFFVIIGGVFDIVYLYLSQRNKDIIIRTQFLGSAKWDFWDICKVAIIFLLAQRTIWIADISMFATVPFLQLRQNLRLMIVATLVDIIAIAAVFYFVLNERRESLSSLGLTRKHFFMNVRYGVVGYIALIPILTLVMYLTMVLFNMFNIPIEPQPLLIMLKEENHIPSLIYMCVFTAVLGPFLEEIFFRGFVYGVFKKVMGISWGIIVSAVFFAYVHANLASIFPIFCLGILLTYLYEKTGSLIPSITVHIIHNSLSLFLLLFVKAVTS
jgi:membrane protease YdiL (CAAX protease family)